MRPPGLPHKSDGTGDLGQSQDGHRGHCHCSDKATRAVSEDHVGSSDKTSLHPLPAREASGGGGCRSPTAHLQLQGETLGVNRGTAVKARLPPAKNEVCSLLHLREWQQRKSAKTEGLNEIQSLTA